MTLPTFGAMFLCMFTTQGRDLLRPRGCCHLGILFARKVCIRKNSVGLWELTDDPEKVKELMLTSINDEITEREPYNGYLVYSRRCAGKVGTFYKKLPEK